MAEREGFEPPGPCGPAVFKTAAIDHSATSPIAKPEVEGWVLKAQSPRGSTANLNLTINKRPDPFEVSAGTTADESSEFGRGVFRANCHGAGN